MSDTSETPKPNKEIKDGRGRGVGIPFCGM
jgi:hypothetical protein